jgi:hypothetical protein
MFCSKCGEKIKEEARFCAKCGTPVNTSSVPNTPPTAGGFGGVTPEQMSVNTATSNPQNVVTEKKDNTVFNIFAIFFVVIGIFLYIYGYYIEFIRGSNWAASFYETCSVIATGVISIGILFSIISLRKKQNKLFFWFCVSYSIFLTLWNFFVWFTQMF